jgi:single-stranded-DNA-specific exonuclease
MAAGMSMNISELTAFRYGLSDAVKQQLSEGQIEDSICIDAELGWSQPDIRLLEEIERLAPFGAGNPPLYFSTPNLKIESVITIGSNKDHRKLILSDQQGDTHDVIWWRGDREPLPDKNFDLLYQLKANYFQGKNIQIVWQHARPSAELLEADHEIKEIQIHDYRKSEDPLSELNEILKKHPQLQIWYESLTKLPLETQNRYQLQQKKHLVILTPPASGKILQSILKQVQAEEIFLFQYQQSAQNSRELLITIGGMLQHILKQKQGWTSLLEISSALGLTDSIIETLLQWWIAKGAVYICDREENRIRLGKQGPADLSQLPSLEKNIHDKLAEILAFQDFYIRTDAMAISQFLL